MWKTVRRWTTQRPKTTAGIVLAVAFVLLNVSAFLHAYAMTHYAGDGPRTEKPESLSLAGKVKVLLVGVRVPRPHNDETPSDQGLSFQPLHFSGNDGTLYEAWSITASESKGLCLLFPGYAESKSRLLNEAAALYRLGYSSLLVDFRGCGGSSGGVTTIGYREAEDVNAAVRFARRQLPAAGPLVLYGRSMGAAAVLRAVSRLGADADAVILESPFDRLLSTVENRFHAMGLPAFPSARLLVFWGGVQHGFWAFSHEPVDYAREVHCPALVMHGAADARSTRDQVQAVVDNLGGETELTLFDGAAHESLLAARPKQWQETVADFLETIPGK